VQRLFLSLTLRKYSIRITTKLLAIQNDNFCGFPQYLRVNTGLLAWKGATNTSVQTCARHTHNNLIALFKAIYPLYSTLIGRRMNDWTSSSIKWCFMVTSRHSLRHIRVHHILEMFWRWSAKWLALMSRTFCNTGPCNGKATHNALKAITCFLRETV
jgi:hypothetical protein